LQQCCKFNIETKMDFKQLLDHHGLSCTPCRVEVLKILSEEGKALSEEDIRKRLTFPHNRSTLFRTLRTFAEKKIIHVISCEGSLWYAFGSAETGKKKANHIHFHCDRCGEITCLPSAILPRITVPAGFSEQSVSLIVNGLCKKCNKR